MSTAVNFSSLQLTTTAASTDRLLLRNSSALSGADGFNQISVGNLERSLSVYSTVQSNSSTNWNYQGTDIKSLTGNWQNTYSTVNSSSASWIQSLSFNSSNAQLSISNGNTISLSALSASGSGGSLPTGGTTNQVLIKNSATSNDASWKNKRTTLTLATLSTTGTLSSNALSADQFVATLSGIALSATIGAPSNPYDAQIIMWNIRYTTNIARVLLDSSFRSPITTLNWTVSANRMDIMAAKYNLLDSKWDIISFAPGYII